MTDPLYSQTIVLDVSADCPPIRRALTQHVVPVLAQMTGATFAVVTSPVSGCVRVGIASAFVDVVPASMRDAVRALVGRPQAFAVLSESAGSVWIVGGGIDGVKNGLLVGWLRALGCRFLMPGWSNVPARSDLRLDYFVTREPAIGTVGLAPSGARGAPYPAPWNTWDTDEAFRWYHRAGRPTKHATASLSLVYPYEDQSVGAGHATGALYSAKRAQIDADVRNFAELVTEGSWKTIRPTNQYFGESTAPPPVSAGVNLGVAANTLRLHWAFTPDGGPSHVLLDVYETDGTDATLITTINSGFYGEEELSIPPTAKCFVKIRFVDGTSPSVDGWIEARGTSRIRQIGSTSFCFSFNGPDELDYHSPGGMIGIWREFNNSRVDKLRTGRENGQQDLVETFSIELPDVNSHCEHGKCVEVDRRGPYAAKLTNPDAGVPERFAHLTNELCRLLQKDRPGAQLWRLGYNQHADISRTPLHRNCGVLVSAYGLANTKLTPDALLDTWEAKAKTDGFAIGVYDYLSLMIWGGGDPRMRLVEAFQKYQRWALNGYEAAIVETGMTWGAIGLHWHVLMRLAWEPHLSLDEIVTEFCADAFGAAAPVMLRIVDRWWIDSTWQAGPVEFSKLFSDLLEAEALVTGEERERVCDFQAYAEYLRLQRDWQSMTTAVPQADRDALADKWFRHIWRSHGRGMIQSRAAHDILYGSTLISSTLKAQWAIPSSASAQTTWRTTNGVETWFTDAELHQITVDAAALYPAINATTVPAPTAYATYGTPTGTGNTIGGWAYGSEGPADGHLYVFHRSTQIGTIVITTKTTQGTAGYLRCVLERVEDGCVLESKQIDVPAGLGATASHSITLDYLTPGFYRLRCFNPKPSQIHSVTFPKTLPIVRVGSYDRAFWTTEPGTATKKFPRYVYVPAGTTEFVVSTQDPTLLAFFDETDVQAPMDPLGLGFFRVIVTAPGVWCMSGMGVRDRLIGIPEITGPTRASMIVPA